MKTNANARLTSIAMIVALTLLLSCQKSEEPDQKTESGLEMTLKSTPECMTSLIAGQMYNIGEVSVNYPTPTTITVCYSITDPAWCLLATHLDVQLDPANFPQTKSGNPKVGQFAYGDELNCAPSWEITVDLTSIDGWAQGMTIYIASHAEVDNGTNEESAWGEGLSFPGNNWAMYFECRPPCGAPLIDARDGKVYSTVKIGEQCWMAQNLNIGARISGNDYQTDNDLIEKFCFNNIEDNCDIYGGLYEWDELMQYTTQEGTQGICPDGWHVPGDGEWTTMTDYVRSQPEYCCNSSTFQIAKALASTNLWNGPATYTCAVADDPSTNNGTGFTGLPGGSRTFTTQVSPQPRFYYLTEWAYWWTSTESEAGKAHGRGLWYNRAGVFTPNVVKETGFSVRCLRDE